MADVPPPAPKLYSFPSPARVRARRLIELGLLSLLAAVAAFWAARQITAHHTLIVDKPTGWFKN